MNDHDSAFTKFSIRYSDRSWPRQINEFFAYPISSVRNSSLKRQHRWNPRFDKAAYPASSIASLASLTFSRLRSNTFPSSITQVDSSTLTSCGKSPSMIGGWPLMPQVNRFFVIVTDTSFGLAEKFTFKGTLIWNQRTIEIIKCILWYWKYYYYFLNL